MKRGPSSGSPSRLSPDALLGRLFHNAHHPGRWAGAACGGLEPPPARRLRGAIPPSPTQHQLRSPYLHRVGPPCSWRNNAVDVALVPDLPPPTRGGSGWGDRTIPTAYLFHTSSLGRSGVGYSVKLVRVRATRRVKAVRLFLIPPPQPSPPGGGRTKAALNGGDLAHRPPARRRGW